MRSRVREPLAAPRTLFCPSPVKCTPSLAVFVSIILFSSFSKAVCRLIVECLNSSELLFFQHRVPYPTTGEDPHVRFVQATVWSVFALGYQIYPRSNIRYEYITAGRCCQ